MMGSSPLSIDRLDLLRARHLVMPARGKPLSLGLAPIDAVLPDAGLPRAAVVQLCSDAGLGHATAIALAACAAAQREPRLGVSGSAESAWCAWIDSSSTLFAPGVARAGVDLDRLLVLRPSADALARVAVRLASSRLFSVIVIDRAGVPGAIKSESHARWSTVVRRLGLALEESEHTIVLLDSLRQARSEPLPVAMRIELTRSGVDRLAVRVSKDRHGRIGGPYLLSLAVTARGAAA